MREIWNNIGTPYKILIVAVLGLVVLWGAYGVYNAVSNKIDIMVDNYKDKQLADKDAELQKQKEENNKVIEQLTADNQKLKEDRIALDVEIKALKAAIENDGKLSNAEERKIEDAIQRYNNEKDSCSAIDDIDARVRCVCSKLGVNCD